MSKRRTPKSSEDKVREPFIGTQNQAEPWQRDNPYIMTGYRVGFTNNWLCFKSLFMFHNETGNVWSHLLGALAFVWFGLYVFLYYGKPQVEIAYETCPVQQD